MSLDKASSPGSAAMLKTQHLSCYGADRHPASDFRVALYIVFTLDCRFLRFPGGCYVEGGDWLKDRFQWKQSLGPAGDRPGHYNEIWGYWSTDGAHEISCSLCLRFLPSSNPACCAGYQLASVMHWKH